MPQFLSPVLFNKNPVRGVVIDPLSSAPASPVAGQAYFDTVLGRMQFYQNSAWGNTSDNSLLLNGQNAAFYLSRANHTGTQLANTISDLASTVYSYRLDQFAAPTANVSFNSIRITNLADPTGSQDAATMGWVQSQLSNAAAGIDSKPSVRVVSNSNITLSGTQTIDGIAVIAGDRVLVRGQTTASTNGVYVVAAGAWTRAVDADATGEMTPGAFWFVEEGTTYGKSQWRIENTGSIVLGTTSITVNQFGAATSYTEGNGINITGSVIEAQIVASGGLVNSASGLAIDTAIVARKVSGSIGNGSNASLTFTHNLGTKDVQVTLRLVATDEIILADVVTTDINNITVSFGTAPAANAIRVTVIG